MRLKRVDGWLYYTSIQTFDTIMIEFGKVVGSFLWSVLVEFAGDQCTHVYNISSGLRISNVKLWGKLRKSPHQGILIVLPNAPHDAR